MKKSKITGFNLIFILAIPMCFVACNKDDDDSENDQTAQEIFEAKLCRSWDVESFLENGIERASELKSQDCYKPIRLKGGYDRILAGVNQSIDCHISGSWGESYDLDSIGLNFHVSPFIGIGPYAGDQYCNYEILQLSDTDFKLSGHYNGSEYVITFKPF